MPSPEGRMRLEYFGGSFNPLTLGGIAVADWFFEQDRVDGFIFSPCGKHDFGKVYEVKDEQRVELIQMGANYLNQRWRSYGKVAAVWRGELRQKDKACESYKAMLELQELFPHAVIRCLIGADLVARFREWKNWEKIVEMGLDIYNREGADVSWIPEGANLVGGRLVNGASSKLKQRIADGESLDGWVLPEQEAYMRENGLYGFAKKHYWLR